MTFFNSTRIRFRDLWYLADSEHKGALTALECYRLVSILNINMSPPAVSALFHKCDKNHNGRLQFEEFLDFIGNLEIR
jgi:Ca2+-binding EF-hand superfamily protein